jgi:hypothetical protein
VKATQKKDQEVQWKGQSDDDFDAKRKRANKTYDAESYTMGEQNADKQESAAQTMRFELEQQSWRPSFAMPRIIWGGGRDGEPAPIPRMLEPNGYRDMPIRQKAGRKGVKEPVPYLREQAPGILKGMTADGIEYNIWSVAKQKAGQGVKQFAKDAAKFGANATLEATKFAGKTTLMAGKAVGQTVFDYLNESTFDFGGKGAEREKWWQAWKEGNAGLNNSLAIMGRQADEDQEKWSKHLKRYALTAGPETEVREHRPSKHINWNKTVGGRALDYVKRGSLEFREHLDIANML